jgi:hypothetical protein
VGTSDLDLTPSASALWPWAYPDEEALWLFAAYQRRAQPIRASAQMMDTSEKLQRRQNRRYHCALKFRQERVYLTQVAADLVSEACLASMRT